MHRIQVAGLIQKLVETPIFESTVSMNLIIFPASAFLLVWFSTVQLACCKQPVFVAVLGRIEHYSVVQFNRITTFEVLQCKTSVKGGAHTHSEDP